MNAVSSPVDLMKKPSVRFSGDSQPGSSVNIFRPVSTTSCVSTISEISMKVGEEPGPLQGASSSSIWDSPKQIRQFSLKKTALMGSRSIDNLDEEPVEEWDHNDIVNGGDSTTRSEYMEKSDESPRGYQGAEFPRGPARVRGEERSDSEVESIEGLGFEEEKGDGEDDDESSLDDDEVNDGSGDDSLVTNSMDDDEDDCDDDLGEEVVQLDDELLASALEDLCIQRPKGDSTDWQWNAINPNLDIGSSLLCPADQENIKLGIRFGKAEAIGGRQYMEDRIFVSPSLHVEGSDEGFELAYFGVFDGHNGEYVADLLQQTMHVSLLANITTEKSERAVKCLTEDGRCSAPESPIVGLSFNLPDDNGESGKSGKSGDSRVKAAHVEPVLTLGNSFVRTAAELDLQILTRDYQRQQCSLHTGTLDAQTFAGCVFATVVVTSASAVSTAVSPKDSPSSPSNAAGLAKTDVVSWVKKEKPLRWIKRGSTDDIVKTSGIRVMVGHTGDCRAVMSEKGGVARALTMDHKPQLASEKERIEVAGGWVHNNRVNGVLAVSRSFGDIQYKTFDGTTRFLTAEEEGGIWSKTQQVISKPDILEFSVEACHEFVVIASDGLWDVFSSQECVNYVRWQLKQQGGDLTKTAEALLSAAFLRGTADNTSAVIVAFNQTDTAEERVDLSTSVCPIMPPASKLAKINRPYIRLP
jgi:serine/threonine protein phosphatase PrpC